MIIYVTIEAVSMPFMVILEVEYWSKLFSSQKQELLYLVLEVTRTPTLNCVDSVSAPVKSRCFNPSWV